MITKKEELKVKMTYQISGESRKIAQCGLKISVSSRLEGIAQCGLDVSMTSMEMEQNSRRLIESAN